MLPHPSPLLLAPSHSSRLGRKTPLLPRPCPCAAGISGIRNSTCRSRLPAKVRWEFIPPLGTWMEPSSPTLNLLRSHCALPGKAISEKPLPSGRQALSAAPERGLCVSRKPRLVEKHSGSVAKDCGRDLAICRQNDVPTSQLPVTESAPGGCDLSAQARSVSVPRRGRPDRVSLCKKWRARFVTNRVRLRRVSRHPTL
jgi:hypothetical protein